jgi:hypothetical protein
VIGAFVLEIGDQQETAPNTSFDSDQRTEFLHNWNKANLTTVEIAHAGGNNLDVQQMQIKYRGNTSLWYLEDSDNPSQAGPITPQPDIRATLGTNQKAEFTSGESWRLNAFQLISDDLTRNCNYGGVIVTGQGYPVPRVTYPPGSCNAGGGFVNGEPMYTRDNPDEHNFDESGHDVTVVWEASSGGKSQAIFKYTTQ